MKMSRYAVGWMAAVIMAVPGRAQGQGAAQRDVNAHQQPARPPRMGRMGQMSPERARIQRMIRQAFTRAVRIQVGLSDDQMRKLAPINRRFVQQRQALGAQERETRMGLRAELAKAEPDQAKVQQYLDQMDGFQHQRLDLTDAEGKELGGIMTPVQLAKYRALQEKVQRQLTMMRHAAGDSARPVLPPGGGPR
ncbi:MAG: hypothetical protein ACYCVL_05155 [Gemmatimonadaceae bacterium]